MPSEAAPTESVDQGRQIRMEIHTGLDCQVKSLQHHLPQLGRLRDGGHVRQEWPQEQRRAMPLLRFPQRRQNLAHEKLKETIQTEGLCRNLARRNFQNMRKRETRCLLPSRIERMLPSAEPTCSAQP